MTQTAPHILMVEARFYEDIADHLTQRAAVVFQKHGATFERLEVAGAFEIPAAIAFAVEACERGTLERPYDGYLALGCVIRGETSHYDIVAGESARGLMDLAVRRHVALANGILTVDNRAQAIARAVDRNKGGETAEACLAMIDIKRKMIRP